LVRIEFVTVGKELLIGRTLNSNAHWAGRRLALMGTMIARMSTIDDDLEEISSSVREALRRSPDFVVVVGGLGPTPDDMTLRGVAVALGRRMSVNKEALKIIRQHYSDIGRPETAMTAARRKMASLPQGAVPMANRMGTAPGVRIFEKSTVIFCLPGVPAEMKDIFRRSVEPELRGRLGRLFRKAIRLGLEGIFESDLAPFILEELKKHPGAYIKSHPRGLKEGRSRIELDIVVVKENGAEARSEAEEIARSFVSRAGTDGASVKFIRGAGRAS
jgi:nicotinamide-nucleotide amidase